MRWIYVLALCLIAPMAWAAPSVSGPDTSPGSIRYVVGTRSSDSDDTRAMEVGGVCNATYSGTDTLELYAVATKQTATGSGTLITTFSAATTTAYNFTPAQPYVKVVATGSPSGDSVLWIRCSLTQMSAGGVGAADVLIGGVDGVDDVANPNDLDADGVFTDELVCTRTNADCFYLSTTTGWWAATTTDTTSDTDWSPLQQSYTLERVQIQPNASTAAFATYDDTNGCGNYRQQYEIASWGACSSNDRNFQWNRTATITGITAGVSQSNATTESSTYGCDIRIAEYGTGSIVAITGVEVEVPDVDTAPAGQAIYRVPVAPVEVTPGEPLRLQIQDGTNCGAGTGCDCLGNGAAIWVEIDGYFQ